HLSIRAGTILGLGSAVSWALGTLLIKTWRMKIDICVLTAYHRLFGGGLLFIGSSLLDDAWRMVNLNSLFILLCVVIMASIVQCTIWFYLIQTGDPGKTSAFLFLAPFFGVLSGALLLDESIHWYVILGGGFILLGIFFANWQPQKVKYK